MQTVYTPYNDPLQLGNIADTSLRQLDSFLAEGVVGIAKAVIRGTNKERQVQQAGTGAGTAANIVGIAILTQSVEQTSSGVVQFNDKTAVPVMRKGRVVIETNDAVIAGTKANFVLANGKWTDEPVAAGIEAPTQIQASFVTGTTAAGLAIIEISNLT